MVLKIISSSSEVDEVSSDSSEADERGRRLSHDDEIGVGEAVPLRLEVARPFS